MRSSRRAKRCKPENTTAFCIDLPGKPVPLAYETPAPDRFARTCFGFVGPNRARTTLACRRRAHQDSLTPAVVRVDVSVDQLDFIDARRSRKPPCPPGAGVRSTPG